jgi:hypothetical protein
VKTNNNNNNNNNNNEKQYAAHAALYNYLTIYNNNSERFYSRDLGQT